PPPGRMRVLPGLKETTLIDDSYNSSPDACVAALESLKEFQSSGRKFAVLGDMADLGPTSEAAHRGLARTVIDEHVDVLVTVGLTIASTSDEARKLGMPGDRILHFDDPIEAAESVLKWLHPGDVILVKGSQVSRMERFVKNVMAEPQRAT